MAEQSPEGFSLNDRRVAGGLLFLSAGQYTLAAYGTLNSSPWTAESFGADDRRRAALRQYVTHAAVVSTLYCGAAGFLVGHPVAPLAAAVLNNVYLIYLYNRAVRRAMATGSNAWPDGTGAR